MRFINWLENGQPVGLQDASTTENGVYAVSDGLSETRTAGAKYFLPSEDEWYKAAYYDANSAVYFNYPTGTDSLPNNNLPTADTGNSANFNVFNSAGNHYTTGSISYPLTDVGSYAQSASPYGVFDLGGNVSEWNERLANSTARLVRGGDWLYTGPLMQASSLTVRGPTTSRPRTRFPSGQHRERPRAGELRLANGRVGVGAGTATGLTIEFLSIRSKLNCTFVFCRVPRALPAL